MIPKYINDWLDIIEKMNNDNTYKLAWGRAIVECVFNNAYSIENEYAVISFEDISRCIIKYYWNQQFFFNLKQSPYKDKEPVICQLVNELIDSWKQNKNSVIPAWYNEEDVKSNNEYLFNINLNKIIKTLHENVSWRFLNVGNDIIQVYLYQRNVSNIMIELENTQLLKDYSVVISKLLNYKWTQLLEKFNYQPKIASKVLGLSDSQIRRNNLKKYKDELLKEHQGIAIDFYSGNKIDESDISVDHVIPWSFMYSDDIWNLVLTSKSHNSSKSNTIPTDDDIKRLKERNINLLNYVSDKYKLDIQESINNNYVDKFYFDCRL